MARALGTARDGSRIQRRRVRGMQPPPLARQQVVVHRLCKEGMPEPIGVRAVLCVDREDLRRNGLPQRPFDVGLGGSGDLGQQVRLHRPPGHCGDPEDPLGVLRQRCHACHQDVPKRRRQTVAGRAGTRRQQLLDEERIALRATLDRLEHLEARALAEDRADLRVELRAAEPADLDADDPGQALHLRQPRPERVTPVQLVGAVGTDDGQPLGPRVPGEEGQHVTGGAVGPVQVLDDEEDRDALAERSQEHEQPFEDPRLDPAGSIEHVGIGRSDGTQFGTSRPRSLVSSIRSSSISRIGPA